MHKSHSSKHKEFKVKFFHTNGMEITKVYGRDFADAIARHIRSEAKYFRKVIGFILIEHEYIVKEYL